MSNLAAIFGAGFDTNTVEPQGDFEVIPPGKVPVVIDKSEVKLTKKHLQNSILLAQDWKQSLDFIIKTVGKPSKERMYDKVLGHLTDCGGTTTRSSLMKIFHLESRDMTRIVDTLLDREQITTNGRLVSLR